MNYRIADLETGRVWYTSDQAEAHKLSFEHDRYDVEERPPVETNRTDEATFDRSDADNGL